MPPKPIFVPSLVGDPTTWPGARLPPAHGRSLDRKAGQDAVPRQAREDHLEAGFELLRGRELLLRGDPGTAALHVLLRDHDLDAAVVAGPRVQNENRRVVRVAHENRDPLHV